MSTQLNKPKDNTQISNDQLQQEVVNNPFKTSTWLENGKSVISLQAGVLYPIMYKEILAGEKIETWNIDAITRLLTPLVPTLDHVYVTYDAYFVPHTRVWKDAERALARKADADTKIKYLPYYTTADTTEDDQQQSIRVQNTVQWRDTLFARYGAINKLSDETMLNALLPRGYRAIFNDFIRNKEYEKAKVEWNDNEVGVAEKKAFNPHNETATDHYLIEAAPARKTYLQNIKKQMQETSVTSPTNLTTHLDWQTNFIEQKQNIANANKNDWEIIAEMGGTAPVTADRVQHLGRIEYELNYQQITQSSATRDGETALGTTGGFSFTRANGTLINYKEFQQHGFIHILMNISTDNDYETMVPKELLKFIIDDIYTPATAKKEIQMLKNGEVNATNDQPSIEGIAFQPAWAEYSRMPRFITGDTQSNTLKGINGVSDQLSLAHWHNFKPEGYLTITPDYLRPFEKTQDVLRRNNVINYDNDADLSFRLLPDMLICISEHKVKSALPISYETLESKEQAQKTR